MKKLIVNLSKNKLIFVFASFISFLMFFGLAIYGFFRMDLPQIIDVSNYKPKENSKVYAQNGELIAEYGSNFRLLLKPEEIPLKVKQAFIASEDKNFYSHHGIDFFGVVKAISQSIFLQRQSLRGASTITQQLAKSLLIAKDGYAEGAARTFSRKIKEAILARRLEINLKKEDILWIYLNDVYLGQGAYGIQAASQAYFRKNIDKLSIAQMALLAGLPQAPSRYSPIHNPKLALSRQNYVLTRMKESGFINQKEFENAIDESKKLVFYERKNSFRQIAPYFSEHIRKDLVNKFGEKKLYEEGLSIYTTLNIEHQETMSTILKEHLNRISKRQGYFGPIYKAEDRQKTLKLIEKINRENLLSLPKDYFIALVLEEEVSKNLVKINLGQQEGFISLLGMQWAREVNPEKSFSASLLSSVKGVLKPNDVILVKKSHNENTSPQNFFTLEMESKVEGAMINIESDTGYVTSLNGGYSFTRSEFNRVYQSCRQPGSTFKPIVYLAALEAKEYNPATMIMDAPLTFRSFEGSSWKPRNLGEHYKGEVTLREAITNSMNVPTLNLAMDVGITTILDFAKKLGIKTECKNELGTAIGSSCVIPNEIANVFLTFANFGIRKEQIMLKEIVDKEKNRIFFNADYKDQFLLRKDKFQLLVKQVLNPSNRVFSKETAYTMNYLLSGVVKHGTAARASSLGFDVAGKTGTTNDSYDTWFAGIAKNLTSVIWVGYDDMKIPLGVYEQGARTTLPIYVDFAAKVLPKLPERNIIMPDTMCNAFIDSKTGFRIEKLTDVEKSFEAPFICGKEPMFLSSAQQKKSLDEVLDSMDNF